MTRYQTVGFISFVTVTAPSSIVFSPALALSLVFHLSLRWTVNQYVYPNAKLDEGTAAFLPLYRTVDDRCAMEKPNIDATDAPY